MFSFYSVITILLIVEIAIGLHQDKKFEKIEKELRTLSEKNQSEVLAVSCSHFKTLSDDIALVSEQVAREAKSLRYQEIGVSNKISALASKINTKLNSFGTLLEISDDVQDSILKIADNVQDSIKCIESDVALLVDTTGTLETIAEVTPLNEYQTQQKKRKPAKKLTDEQFKVYYDMWKEGKVSEAIEGSGYSIGGFYNKAKKIEKATV